MRMLVPILVRFTAADTSPSTDGAPPACHPSAIDYPSSDDKPLAENDPQLHAILHAFGALRLRYRDRRPDASPSADLLIYYEEATRGPHHAGPALTPTR